MRNLRTAAGLGDLDAIDRCFDDSGRLTPAAGEVAWPFFSKPIPQPLRRDREQVVANALVNAAAWGRTRAVDKLLERGAPVNLTPAGFDYAGTLLHYAALHGRRDMVDHLLRHGADPPVRDTKIGKLPEDWAEHSRHRDLSECLRRVRTRGGWMHRSHHAPRDGTARLHKRMLVSLSST